MKTILSLALLLTAINARAEWVMVSHVIATYAQASGISGKPLWLEVRTVASGGSTTLYTTYYNSYWEYNETTHQDEWVTVENGSYQNYYSGWPSYVEATSLGLSSNIIGLLAADPYPHSNFADIIYSGSGYSLGSYNGFSYNVSAVEGNYMTLISDCGPSASIGDATEIYVYNWVN